MLPDRRRDKKGKYGYLRQEGDGPEIFGEYSSDRRGQQERSQGWGPRIGEINEEENIVV